MTGTVRTPEGRSISKGEEVLLNAKADSERNGSEALVIIEELGRLSDKEISSIDKSFREHGIERFVLSNDGEYLFRNIMGFEWFGWKLVGVKRVRCSGDLTVNGLEFKQTDLRFVF